MPLVDAIRSSDRTFLWSADSVLETMALVKILLYILKYPDNMNNVKVALVPYDRHGEHPDPDFITLMNNASSLARNDLMEVNALWEAYIGGDASKLIDLA